MNLADLTFEPLKRRPLYGADPLSGVRVLVQPHKLGTMMQVTLDLPSQRALHVKGGDRLKLAFNHQGDQVLMLLRRAGEGEGAILRGKRQGLPIRSQYHTSGDTLARQEGEGTPTPHPDEGLVVVLSGDLGAAVWAFKLANDHAVGTAIARRATPRRAA